MRDPLRIGVIGCGAMGQEHVRIWDGISGARVSAVCDYNGAMARVTAERINALGYDTVEEMLDAGEIDAVDICTPSGLHVDQGLLAARRNLHILCEKPLDINLEKADRLIAECDARGLTLACIFQRRSYSGAQQIARYAADGRFGRILSCSGYVKWWRSPEYYASSAWRGSWKMDGGVLANQAIHTLDLMCWLAGPVEEVEYAHLATETHELEAEDHAIAVLRFTGGARGVIEATTCCTPDLCTRVEMFGERGSVSFDDAMVVRFGLDGEDRLASIDQPQETIGGRSQPMDMSLRGHVIQMADFVEAVRDRRKPLVSGHDARLSLEALNRIYHKAFPGQRLGT